MKIKYERKIYPLKDILKCFIGLTYTQCMKELTKLNLPDDHHLIYMLYNGEEVDGDDKKSIILLNLDDTHIESKVIDIKYRPEYENNKSKKRK